MKFCQHAQRLRLQFGPGRPDVVSERPRNKKSGVYLDGPAGTQVDVPDDAVGIDRAMLLANGALAPLPCREHPAAPTAARVPTHSARNAATAEGEAGGG